MAKNFKIWRDFDPEYLPEEQDIDKRRTALSSTISPTFGEKKSV